PTDCANGPTGSDQWDLVLGRRPVATAPICRANFAVMSGGCGAVAILAHIRGLARVQGSYDGAVGSRAGEYQQHGGNDAQEIAGGPDPERRVDAEGNAGDNGNARSKDACGSVDPPEPGRGTGLDGGDQTHAGWKSKAHQEARRRQDKNTEAGTNQK